MENVKILDDLQMFSSYNGFINLSFNQYLLLGSEPLLIHTGSKDQTAAILPRIKELLGEKPLSYIFISHFESDECGGLGLLKECYPEAKPVCSQVTARQLMGFGLATDIMTKASGDTLETTDYTLSFLSYPSEMHLWEGLLAFEKKRGLLFSSDLFIRFGELNEQLIKANLDEEIQGITLEKIPSQDALEKTKDALNTLPVKYIVPGHGPCLIIE